MIYLCQEVVEETKLRIYNYLFFISYNMKINKTISKLYNNAGLMEKYGGQVWLTILILFIFGVIFTYVNILNHINSVKKNWGHERCNPFIIPLAGWINNTNKETESDFQYTIDNFEFCLGKIASSVFVFITDAFKFILSSIEDIFKDILSILSAIINFLMSIITGILSMLENAWGLALQSSVGLQQTLNKSRDSINRFVGFVVVTLYTNMMLFRMSMMWLITTPVFMLFTLLIRVLVKIILFCIRSQARTVYLFAKFAACIIFSNTSFMLQKLATALGISSVAEIGAAIAGQIASFAEFATATALAAGIITAPAAPAAFAAAAVEEVEAVGSAVAGGVSATGAAISESGSMLAMGFRVANCALTIMIAIWRVLSIIMTAVQITALIVILYLLYLCFAFVKATLGQMNIPGQGIPGLSF